MLKHRGGEQVKGGLYWQRSNWEIVTVEGKIGTLPGNEQSKYLKVPTVLFIPVALLMSGLYVIFLPFIGFAMLANLVARKTAQRVWGMVRALEQKMVAF